MKKRILSLALVLCLLLGLLPAGALAAEDPAARWTAKQVLVIQEGRERQQSNDANLQLRRTLHASQ